MWEAEEGRTHFVNGYSVFNKGYLTDEVALEHIKFNWAITLFVQVLAVLRFLWAFLPYALVFSIPIIGLVWLVSLNYPLPVEEPTTIRELAAIAVHTANKYTAISLLAAYVGSGILMVSVYENKFIKSEIKQDKRDFKEYIMKDLI